MEKSQKEFYEKLKKESFKYLDRLNIIYTKIQIIKDYIDFIEKNNKLINEEFKYLNFFKKQKANPTTNLFDYLIFEIASYYDLCSKNKLIKKEEIKFSKEIFALRHLIAHTDLREDLKSKDKFALIHFKAYNNFEEIYSNFLKFHLKIMN